VLPADDQTRWASAAGLVARDEIAAAADLLDGIGAHTDAASVRVVAAHRLVSQDPQRAAAQLELAATFYRGVGATAVLVELDELRSRFRLAAS